VLVASAKAGTLTILEAGWSPGAIGRRENVLVPSVDLTLKEEASRLRGPVQTIEN